MKSHQIPDWAASMGKKPTKLKEPRNRLLSHITDDEMCEGEIEYMFETFSKPTEF